MFGVLYSQSTITNRRPNRVVITGAGIITALGRGWRSNADGFRAGRVTFRPVTLFDVSRQRAKLAAQIEMPARMPKTLLSERALGRTDRATRLLLLAAHEAWSQSSWEPGGDLPVVLGTTGAGMACGEDYLRHALESPHRHKGQPTRVAHYQASRQGLDLCDAFGFDGDVIVISNACASGANALGHAFELVRSGRAARAFAGGYDALCLTTYAGFDSLRALSITACRPFDSGRDGLLLGEGAAMLALESLDAAQNRGAEILGEIIGYGATTDIHHLTQPHPDGKAAVAAMNAACQEAGIAPEQVDYLNAHGTATPQNDASEAAAINCWAGGHAKDIQVSSTKGGVGHLLGAAGAVEAVVCLMAMREQWLPPQAALETPDPVCRFSLVRKPREAKVAIAMSNSFGFGGANAALLFRRLA